jgi:deoxyribodipyrimidine photo-lyase
MLVSFASYHLWLHWRPTARFLAQHFLDFEPGIHFAQFQMQSGTTGINTVRIYSPIKQVTDHDPTGVFIRRWAHELAEVPDEYLAEPWAMPEMTQHMAGCTIGEDYPAPIVNHRAAYAHAKGRVYEVKRSAAARQQADRVQRKHGSRRGSRSGTRRRAAG